MPKVSPLRNNFTAGVFSETTLGRVDLEKYPAGARELRNYISLPQGPAVRRSGTVKLASAAFDDDEAYSHLVPFAFNETQLLMIEFADERVCFHTHDGALVRPAVAVSQVVTVSPFVVRAAGHGVVVGEQVVLSGLDAALGLANERVNVIGVSGTDITLDWPYAGVSGAVTGVTVARVYHIASPYQDADVRAIRAQQYVDDVFLWCPGYRPYKLSRYGTYDWRLAQDLPENGPFAPVTDKMGQLSIDVNGSPIPDMTSATAPSGTVTKSGEASGAQAAWNAFDGKRAGTWVSNTVQTGWIAYEFPTAVAIKGYVIFTKIGNTEDYTNVDFAPGNWTLQGSNDGTNYTVLDRQDGYVAYSGGRSANFPVPTETAYKFYKLDVDQCTRNGNLAPAVGLLLLQARVDPTITLTLSGTYTDVNKGAGFLSTDVDRLLRVKDADGFYRFLRISAYVSATQVEAKLLSEPFTRTGLQIEWAIGYWSDTTGWPKCGAFYQDRKWQGGAAMYPDVVAGSRTGAYSDYAQKTGDNRVLDDNAIVVRPNSRQMPSIRWLNTDERGLLVGTGSREYVLTYPEQSQTGLTPANHRVKDSTERGSADTDAVKIDRQVLFIQRAKRAVREFAYDYQVDGYRTPSMSMFAPHLGAKKFEQLVYAAEPNSIVWVRRADGLVCGLTYWREENVMGWHEHDFSGEVEDIATLPSPTTGYDELWLVIRRTLGDGTKRRYIERMQPDWDFGFTLDDAWYVDSGLMYEGAPTISVQGLHHLEGLYVKALCDNVEVEELIQVVDGRVDLPFEASRVVVGLPITASIETSNKEGGSATGTSQGKMKRDYDIVLLLWDSAGGEVGRYNDTTKETEWSRIEYAEDPEDVELTKLSTGFIEMTMPQGYARRGSMSIRTSSCLPLNIISLLPRGETND